MRLITTDFIAYSAHQLAVKRAFSFYLRATACEMRQRRL